MNVSNNTLAVVGSFLTIVGAINAFFIKDLIEKINRLHIDFVENRAQGVATNSIVSINTSSIKRINDDIIKVRERIHRLEGGQSSMLRYIKENEEDRS